MNSLLSQSKSYIKLNFNILKSSFKNSKKLFIPIYLYDILFFLIFTGSLIFLSSVSKNLASQYTSLKFVAADAVVTSLFQSLFLSIGLLSIIYYALFLVVYSSLKSFIWQRIFGLKISWNLTYKFFQICIVWISIFVVVFILFLFSIKNTFYTNLIYVAGFVWFHFSTIISWRAVKHPRVRKTLTKTFDIGVTKIHKFILPYAISVLFFLVYAQIWRLAPKFIILNPVYSLLTYVFVILVPVLIWFRIYMAKVLDNF